MRVAYLPSAISASRGTAKLRERENETRAAVQVFSRRGVTMDRKFWAKNANFFIGAKASLKTF